MLVRIVAVLLVIFASSQSNATLIQYQLDQDSGVVSSRERNLEWLQWERTKEMSIDRALDVFKSGGWRVATSQEVFTLLDDFSLLPSAYDYPHNRFDVLSITQQSYETFTAFFGLTSDGISSKASQAYFGEGDDNGRHWRWAGLRDITVSPPRTELVVRAPGFFTTSTSQSNAIGVALVRSSPNFSANSIGEPPLLLAISLAVAFAVCSRFKY